MKTYYKWFQLSVLHEDVFGDYVCIAENKHGKLERVVVLEKGQEPPIPTIQVIISKYLDYIGSGTLSYEYNDLH